MYREALRKFERIAETVSEEDLNKISQIVLDELEKIASGPFNAAFKAIRNNVNSGLNAARLNKARKQIKNLGTTLAETTKANEALKATNTVLSKNNKILKGVATTGTLTGIGGVTYGLSQKKKQNEDPNSAMY